MNLKSKEKIRTVLTVIGWMLIGFALMALIIFILNSGVLNEQI